MMPRPRLRGARVALQDRETRGQGRWPTAQFRHGSVLPPLVLRGIWEVRFGVVQNAPGDLKFREVGRCAEVIETVAFRARGRSARGGHRGGGPGASGTCRRIRGWADR